VKITSEGDSFPAQDFRGLGGGAEVGDVEQGARRGFSLIELCCVGILSILTSISALNYQVYVRRARATEALTQVESLAYLEQVRILEVGAPIACGPTPKTIPARGERALFEEDVCWRDLGFRVLGRVRFQYRTETSSASGFSVEARGDLDGDGIASRYTIDSETMELSRENPD
jgi:hypothetical protein